MEILNLMIMNWLCSTEASSWNAGFSYPKENTSPSELTYAKPEMNSQYF